jgi:hypothetical protein
MSPVSGAGPLAIVPINELVLLIYRQESNQFLSCLNKRVLVKQQIHPFHFYQQRGDGPQHACRQPTYINFRVTFFLLKKNYR